ncbi:MAG: hypothetical protein ABI838_03155 [Chloroflexota bacterium]
MNPLIRLVTVGLAVLALLACAASSRTAAGAQPATSARPAASTPTATPPASRLVMTGAVTGNIDGATAAGPCGPAPSGGLGGELRFQVQGRPWALSISLPGYKAAGTYDLPPGRISLHTLGINPSSQFFGSQKGDRQRGRRRPVRDPGRRPGRGWRHRPHDRRLVLPGLDPT